MLLDMVDKLKKVIDDLLKNSQIRISARTVLTYRAIFILIWAKSPDRVALFCGAQSALFTQRSGVVMPSFLGWCDACLDFYPISREEWEKQLVEFAEIAVQRRTQWRSGPVPSTLSRV